MLDIGRDDLVVGVVGAGLMGRGIAEVLARAGIRVLLYDACPNTAQDAYSTIRKNLESMAHKGSLTSEDVSSTLERVRIVPTLADLAPSHVVIEAIVEDLEAKRKLFIELERIVADTTALATNTSSLLVTAIAAKCRLPARIAGLHFFSPVPRMKLVEVIDGLATGGSVSATLEALARRIGHTPVRARDTPGFIVNHAGRGFSTEALQILREGIADVAQIDAILREAAGFRMGPFELLDLVGLDVSHPAMESIYNQYYQEPRFRPSPITGQRLVAGRLGRKSGAGFYEYADGKARRVAEVAVPVERPQRVWLSRRNSERYPIVRALLGELGAAIDDGERPGVDALCVVLPIGEDATTAALAESLDPTRTVALDSLFLTHRRTVMTTPVTSSRCRSEAHGLFSADGTAVSVIHDSPGFVAQRVTAMIVNIACDMAQQRIAAPRDIDQAVTLGLNYPQGPLAMGDAIGPSVALAILHAMYSFYGDPRYRASPWLTRRARLGVSLLTAEN